VHPNKIKKDLVFAVLQMGYLIITEIICRGGWGKKTPLLIWSRHHQFLQTGIQPPLKNDELGQT
jgi:hypothetical protein